MSEATSPWPRLPRGVPLPLRLHLRIGLVIGTLVLTLALLLGWAASRATSAELTRLAAANLESTSDQLARTLSQGMDAFARDVTAQATRDLFIRPDAPHAELRAQLDIFRRLNPAYAYVALVDARTHTVLAASDGVFEGGSAAGRPVYEEGRKGLFLGDVHPAVRLAELLPKPPDGDALRFLDAAAPVRDRQGEVVRVFVAHVGWTWAQQERDELFRPLLRRGVQAVLVDTHGKVVLAANPSLKVGTDLSALLREVSKPGQHEVAWPDGSERYLTHVSPVRPRGAFDGFGWRVVAREPLSLVQSPARSVRDALLGGAVAVGLFGALLAWWLGARLVRPVSDLAKAAAGDGPSPPDDPPPGAPAEVRQMHRALQRWSDQVEAQQQARDASELRFSTLARALPQVVWVADEAGRLLSINRLPEGADLPEGSLDSVDSLARLIEPSERGTFERAWARSRPSGDALHLRCRLRWSADPIAPLRWHELHADPLTSVGGGPGWVGTLFDVHEIVTVADAAARALAEERHARTELERLARLRDEFLATVSHELRSPLSAVSGWAEILQRTDAMKHPMVARAAPSIHRNAATLTRQIDDLMDVTALEAGKVHLDLVPMDVMQVAREVAESERLRTGEAALIEVLGDGPVVVAGDARRLRQILRIAIGNALKFGHAGDPVTVEVGQQDGRAVVQVSDRGIGIGADFLPHAFDRLRQEDASIRREHGGLGLGLTIARALTALHRGRIEIDSPGRGQGTCVTLTLPLAGAGGDEMTVHEARAAASARWPSTEAGALGPAAVEGMRVLLVDDEAEARSVARAMLESLGADVVLAASGAQALELIDGPTRFDLLLSDIAMPGMDGLALVRAVRARARGARGRLLAVALSAFALETDRRRGLDAGFDAYVSKPISVSGLLAGVARAQAAQAMADDDAAEGAVRP